MTGALTLGIVGHVDHGKTALVRALTGIETDRLREERERGLSIALGFAFLETPGGVVDLIDAPGHEDFIRTMISGAGGFTGILLCIAANEGLMPQTIEHFNIAGLLGVAGGAVVITKCDLVGDEALNELKQTVAAFCAGSYMEAAPVVCCSAATGAGLAELRSIIAEIAASAEPQMARSRFFMPLDRVFSLRGFGLVVTGTLRRGQLVVGDRVEVVPGEIEASVRGLHNHHVAVEQARPGQRVAVNLRGVSREEVHRGDVLATPDLLRPSQRLDAELTLLAGAPALRNGTRVQLLTGTIAVTARVRLLDRAALEGGATCFVQWRLERSIATHSDERYIVRSLSPAATLGGGRILDVGAGRHRRFDPGVLTWLKSAASGDIDRMVAESLGAAGLAPVSLATLSAATGAKAATLRRALAVNRAIEVDPDSFIGTAAYAGLVSQVSACVAQFHLDEPRRLGVSVAGIAAAIGLDANAAALRMAISSLVDRLELIREGEFLHLPGFDPLAGLSDRERQLLVRIEREFLAAGLGPSPLQQAIGSDPFRQSMLKLLLHSQRLIRLRTYDRDTRIILHSRVVADAVAAIADAYPYPAAFAVKDIRDLLGSTRRHIIPLMEHLDAIGATERSGDCRRLKSR